MTVSDIQTRLLKLEHEMRYVMLSLSEMADKPMPKRLASKPRNMQAWAAQRAKRHAEAAKVYQLVKQGFSISEACKRVGMSRQRYYIEMRLESQPGKDDLLS